MGVVAVDRVQSRLEAAKAPPLRPRPRQQGQNKRARSARCVDAAATVHVGARRVPQLRPARAGLGEGGAAPGGVIDGIGRPRNAASLVNHGPAWKTPISKYIVAIAPSGHNPWLVGHGVADGLPPKPVTSAMAVKVGVAASCSQAGARDVHGAGRASRNAPSTSARSDVSIMGASLQVKSPRSRWRVQSLPYSSRRRHQMPADSFRPRGARSSHWYAPHRPSRPRAYVE